MAAHSQSKVALTLWGGLHSSSQHLGALRLRKPKELELWLLSSATR